MKTAIVTTFLLASSVLCLNAQLSPDWVKMTVPTKTPNSISIPCGIPTISLNGRTWQSLDTGLTWIEVDNLPIGAANYWIENTTISSTTTPSCQFSDYNVKYFDCQSPDTPYFQYDGYSHNCWHSGGDSYGLQILHDKVFVLASSSWQYMGIGSSCDHQASLDWGHTWFDVPCDYSQKYFVDSTLMFANGILTLHPAGYDQPSYELGPIPDTMGTVIKSIYYDGNAHVLMVNGAYEHLRLLSTYNLGQSWDVDTLQVVGQFTTIYSDAEILFLKTTEGIYYKNLDQSSGFQPIYEGSSFYPTQLTNSFASKNMVIVSVKSGAVYFSKDLGQTWQTANIPIFPVALSALSHNGESLLTFTDEYYPLNEVVVDGDTAFHRVLNAWETLEYPKAAFQIQDTPFKAIVNGNIYKSLNQGQTWEFVSNPFSVSCCANIVKLDGDSLFLSSNYDTIFYSTDGAQTWLKVNFPSPINIKTFEVSGQDWVAMEYFNNSLLHFSGANGQWEDATPDNFKPKQLLKNRKSIYVLGISNQDEWNVREWNTTSQEWDPVGDILKVTATKEDAGDGFFLVQTNDSVFVRQVGGLWETLETPFAPIGHINDWLMFNTTLYAATSKEGLWRSDLSHLFVSSSKTRFSQNSAETLNIYPNPASTSVTLQFEAPPVGDCSVHFINQMGQKLLTKQLGGNSKTHTIDIGELNSGQYFVEISGPNQRTFTTKLHIVR